MAFLLRTALLLLLFCMPLRADEQQTYAVIGHGLACDTSQQVERFVALRNDGKDTAVALQSVNDEADNPLACGIILVAFTPGEPVTQKIIQGEPVTIVAITIHAVNTGLAWLQVPATVQYIFVTEQGEKV